MTTRCVPIVGEDARS